MWHNRAAGPPFSARFDSNMADCFSVFFPCACSYACVVPDYTYDASTSTREWKSFHSLMLVLMSASLCRTFTRRFLILVLVLMLMLASYHLIYVLPRHQHLADVFIIETRRQYSEVKITRLSNARG